jgi:hypothetical protein
MFLFVQAGYQSGLVDYAHDPRGFDKGMMKSIVKSSGATMVYQAETKEVCTHFAN